MVLVLYGTGVARRECLVHHGVCVGIAWRCKVLDRLYGVGIARR